MAEHQLTAFEHVLLGLVCLSPASGYDLKRIFAATPMGVYQPSSGAFYPALRRVEAKGLFRRSGGTSESARRRRVYEPTEVGRATHLTWLRTPVEAATVSRDLGLHLMRFVMMEPGFRATRCSASSTTQGRARGVHRRPGAVRGTSRSSAVATRTSPWTTAWRCTGPASSGPGTPSPRSVALRLVLLRAALLRAALEGGPAGR